MVYFERVAVSVCPEVSEIEITLIVFEISFGRFENVPENAMDGEIFSGC